jgi:hypothetical protein
MCILTTLNNGLRNGGGIGDVLRRRSSQVNQKQQKLNYLEKLMFFIKGTIVSISHSLRLAVFFHSNNHNA